MARGCSRIALALGIVVGSMWLTLTWNTSAGAQQTSSQPLSALIKALENDQQRARLLGELRLLQQAMERAAPKPAGAAAEPSRLNFVAQLQRGIAALSVFFETMARSASELRPDVASLRRLLVDANLRVMVWDILLKMVLLTLGAIVLTVILRRFVGRWRLAPEPAAPAPARWQRWQAFAGRTFLHLLPWGLSLGGAIIFVHLLAFTPQLQAALSAVLLVLLIYKLVGAVALDLFLPEDERLRPVTVAVDQQVYAHIWMRRFLRLGLLGYLPVAAAAALAPGSVLHTSLLGIFKVALAALVCVLLLQAKERLRHAMRLATPAEASGTTRVLVGIANAFLHRAYLLAIGFLFALLVLSLFGYGGGVRYLIRAVVLSAVIMAAAYGVYRFLSLMIDRLFRVSERLRRRYPSLVIETNRYVAFVRGLAYVLLIVPSLALILESWGVPVGELLRSISALMWLGRLTVIVIVVGLTMLAVDASDFAITQLIVLRSGRSIEELGQKGQTILPLVRRVTRYTILSIATLILMESVGISILPILTGAGILGLAVGFGAQSLVKDVLTGIFILVEGSIAVGDVVTVRDTGGVVEAVNLRHVRIRDLAGNVHYIPNSSIDMVTNMTRDFSRYVIDVGVAYKENVDEVIGVLKEIGAELQQDETFGPDILEPLEILGVDDFADSQVTIKIRIVTKPIRQWSIGRELRRRIKNTFDARGIEIPFPHRTIYFGELKDAAPPPVMVKLQEE